MKTSRYNHDSYGIDVANIDERQAASKLYVGGFALCFAAAFAERKHYI